MALCYLIKWMHVFQLVHVFFLIYNGQSKRTVWSFYGRGILRIYILTKSEEQKLDLLCKLIKMERYIMMIDSLSFIK